MTMLMQLAKCPLSLFLLIAMLAGKYSCAQDDLPTDDESKIKQKFVETNFGFAYTNVDLPFPGFSSLSGARKFHANGKTFTDWAVGPALPSLLTGRVGIGSCNPETRRNMSVGVRIFPLYAYTRIGFPRPSREFVHPLSRGLLREVDWKMDGVWCEREFSISIEVSPFLNSSSDQAELSAFYSLALITFGWTSFF